MAAVVFWVLSTAAPEAQVSPVRRDLAVDAVSGNLRIFSAKSLLLRTAQEGRVASVLVPPNSGPVPVKAGEVVVRLATEDLQRELDLAKIKLESARRRQGAGSIHDAPIGDAKADLVIQEELVENNQFPTADLQKTRRLLQSLQVKRELEQALLREEIAGLEAEVSRLESDIEDLAIASPFDGYVTDVFTLEGDLVKEGAPVARMISSENIVEVSLSEEDFARVSPGQTVTARLLSQGTNLYGGKVDVLMAEADPRTRRRAVYVTLDAPAEALVPGTTGQASVTKAQREDVLVIPRRALLGKSVFVVENGQVRRREVETGFLGLNLAEIKSGLDEGDLVIVETPHLFREGEEVSPVESGQ